MARAADPAPAPAARGIIPERAAVADARGCSLILRLGVGALCGAARAPLLHLAPQEPASAHKLPPEHVSGGGGDACGRGQRQRQRSRAERAFGHRGSAVCAPEYFRGGCGAPRCAPPPPAACPSTAGTRPSTGATATADVLPTTPPPRRGWRRCRPLPRQALPVGTRLGGRGVPNGHVFHVPGLHVPGLYVPGLQPVYDRAQRHQQRHRGQWQRSQRCRQGGRRRPGGCGGSRAFVEGERCPGRHDT
mmetsp:Transcript_5789/g.17231  ORF Transcript_5789/g.17231 Transcript_5789/m.17231 type:complete len:247 (-) Transcript_5789:698-1438(-)